MRRTSKPGLVLSICRMPWKGSIKTPIVAGPGNTFSRPQEDQLIQGRV